MEQYLVDAIVFLVIAFCAWRGYRNGIMSGIITIASAVLGIVGAKLLTPTVAPYVGKLISPTISQYLAKWDVEQLVGVFTDEKLPKFLTDALGGSQDFLPLLAADLTVYIQDMVAFFIIFVIIMILAGMVLKYISFHLPLFRTVNRMLGCVFGGLVGLCIMALVCSIGLNYLGTNPEYLELTPFVHNSYFVRILQSVLAK